jgi:hypothetical protein
LSIAAALLLFGVSATSVFSQAFQSRNVNQGHIVAAGLTSLAIGVAQTVSLKMVPVASELGTVMYIVGGPVGVVAAMFVHSRTLGRSKRLAELRKLRKRRPINKQKPSSLPTSASTS